MKGIIMLFTALLFCVGCKSSSPKNLDKYTIDYEIEQSRYAVVVVEDEGISRKSAKEWARQCAAEIAHKHGFRYFIIDQESEVFVLKTSETFSDQNMPRNLYYSMIQSNGFERPGAGVVELNPSSQTPGYRIEFSCQEEKPTSGKYFDVCDYGFCD